MKPTWYVGPSERTITILCLFSIEGRRAGLSETVCTRTGNSEHVKAQVSGAIEYMARRMNSFIEGSANNA